MPTYFVTSATDQRRRIFQTTRNAELLLETLQHYRKLNKYLLHAFVIMPDHIHLLITPQGITIERAMQLIKGGFSHRLDSKHTPWQRSFTESHINDAQEFIARRNYIHQNPVKAHLAPKAEDYPYSSAYRAPQ